MRNWAKQGLLSFLLGAALAIALMATRGHSATTLLPNGKQCFQTASGPVSSGSLNMFAPGTTTPKNTWQDSGQSVLNTNPIQLDANGCAIIYGTGTYRQQLYSGPVVSGAVTGNLIFDEPTADTSSYQNVFWAGVAGGTPNAITVTDAGFNATDGSVINFLALNTNTGSTTLSVSGGGTSAILIPSSAGPLALPANTIIAGNPVSVVWSSANNAFLLLSGSPLATGGGATQAAVPVPGGYLTPNNTPLQPVAPFDAIGVTTVYYFPYTSNQIPIWNGSSYSVFTFGTGLTLNLTGSQLASTLYDVFVFLNNGSPTIGVGPAWSNSGAGTSARGSGGGTTQITRLNGLPVNAVQITAINGATSYTVAANFATYIGTILIDSNAGQVTTNFTQASPAKWGIWNAFNRQVLQIRAADPAIGWVYNTATARASNGNANNTTVVLDGLDEEEYFVRFQQSVNANFSNNNSLQIGVGLNSTSAFTNPPAFANGIAGLGTTTLGTTVIIQPLLGVNKFQALEQGSSVVTNTFFGGNLNMQLLTRWRG